MSQGNYGYQQPGQPQPGYPQPQQQNPYYGQVGGAIMQPMMVPPHAQNEVRGPMPAPSLKSMKLGIVMIAILTVFLGFGLMIAGIAMGSGGDRDAGALAIVGIGVVYLGIFMNLGSVIAGAVWNYKIWRWLPPEQRRAAAGWNGYVSPAAACGFNFIPYFNIYWPFALNLGLADAVNRMSHQRGLGEAVPRDKAMWASLMMILFPLVGIFMMHGFMKKVEESGAAIDNTAVPQNPYALYTGSIGGGDAPPPGGFGG
jgi:hypothetical protein